MRATRTVSGLPDAPKRLEAVPELLRSQGYRRIARRGEHGWEGVRGSRFALHPEGLFHLLRVAADPDGRSVSLSAGSESLFPWQRETAGPVFEAILKEWQARLEGKAPTPPPRGSWSRRAIPLLALAFVTLAIGIAAFWIYGTCLAGRSLDDVRSGRVKWPYYPALEPLTQVPLATRVCAGAFVAWTAGLAAAFGTTVLLGLGTFFPRWSEILGPLLGWWIAFLSFTFGVGPHPGPGGTQALGFADSAWHPTLLLATIAAPLLAWAAASRGFARCGRGGGEPGTALRAAGGIVLCAMAIAPGNAPAAEAAPDGVSAAVSAVPTPLERESAELASQAGFHRFRDRWMLSNPPGRWFTGLYYRYTPYALLTIDPDRYPDRQSLRYWAALGERLWLLFPVGAALGIGVLVVRGIRRAFRAGSGIGWACVAVLGIVAGSGAAAAGREVPRWRAASALQELAIAGTPADVPAALKAVGDPDPRIRLWAMTALGCLGAAEVVEPLFSGLNDPHYLVRSRAAGALRVLALRREAWKEPGSREAAAARASSALREASAREPFLYVRYWMAQALAAWTGERR